MPIYEYKRPDGSTFEVLQGFTDEPLERDPETGVPVERVLHAPAVHFKGKGFYNTDYGTRKRQREKSASGEKGASGESASSGGGESASKGANGASSSNSSDSEKSTSGGEAKGPTPAAKSESAKTSSAS
jgi:putative FmdB family regulatory protein